MKSMKLTFLVMMFLVSFGGIAQEVFFDDVYFSSSKKNKKVKTEENVVQTRKSVDATLMASTYTTSQRDDLVLNEERDVDEYNRRYFSTDELYEEDVETVEADDVVTERRSDTEYTERIIRYHSPSKITIAGADQVWNTTISDYDDAYFLNWVKDAKRIAYAPSFGAKNPFEYAKDIEQIKKYLNQFEHLSIRENNGQKWIEELIGKKVSVVLDPTLIIDKEDYKKITSKDLELPEKYIFYYSPSYSLDINNLVRKISKKYKLPVIAFNGKAYYLRGMELSGFKLPKFEDPTAYLQLMENAEMVITTSFHGSIFSTVYGKKFWVIKNGGMFGDDDRVYTLLTKLNITERLIPNKFDENFDYMKSIDYNFFETLLKEQREFSENYLLEALKG